MTGDARPASSIRGLPGGGKTLKRLAAAVPPDSDFYAMVLGLENPDHDAPSRDRYVAIVASGAVEVALRQAISKHLSAELSQDEVDRTFDVTLGDFARRIGMARALGVISADQRTELDRIRTIRNAFAHTIAPLTFENPEVADVLGRMWHVPVTSWAAHLFTTFLPYRQFIIICASFAAELARYQASRRPRRRGKRLTGDAEFRRQHT
jgi:hypothetical protein